MPNIVDVPVATRGSKYLNDNELAETAQLLNENPGKHIGGIVTPTDTRVKARYAAAQVRKALKEVHNVETRARIFTVKVSEEVEGELKDVEKHTFALVLKPAGDPTGVEVEPEETPEDAEPVDETADAPKGKRNR